MTFLRLIPIHSLRSGSRTIFSTVDIDGLTRYFETHPLCRFGIKGVFLLFQNIRWGTYCARFLLYNNETFLIVIRTITIGFIRNHMGE